MLMRRLSRTMSFMGVPPVKVDRTASTRVVVNIAVFARVPYDAAMPDRTPGIKAGQFVCWMLFLVTAGAPCGCTVWMMEAPALPQSSMAAIQPGMTSEQVRGLLGTPKAVDSNED